MLENKILAGLFVKAFQEVNLVGTGSLHPPRHVQKSHTKLRVYLLSPAYELIQSQKSLFCGQIASTH